MTDRPLQEIVRKRRHLDRIADFLEPFLPNMTRHGLARLQRFFQTSDGFLIERPFMDRRALRQLHVQRFWDVFQSNRGHKRSIMDAKWMSIHLSVTFGLLSTGRLHRVSGKYLTRSSAGKRRDKFRRPKDRPESGQ